METTVTNYKRLSFIAELNFLPIMNIFCRSQNLWLRGKPLDRYFDYTLHYPKYPHLSYMTICLHYNLYTKTRSTSAHLFLICLLKKRWWAHIYSSFVY